MRETTKTEDGEAEIVPRMIHDLRNPIGVMLSFAEIIPTAEGAERADFCARLGASAQRALHVLEDYALLWDLRGGRVERSVGHCSLPRLVRLAVAEAGADVIGPARLSCHGERPGQVAADAGQVLQALRSLARDVLRGAGANGAVRVEIRPSGTSAVVDFSVDLGPEAPAAGRLLGRDALGAELGREVARLHGGSLEIFDRAHGLVAALRLPVEP